MPATDPPIIVKFVNGERSWARQLPGGSPAVGRCRFLLDPEAREYDWLVVYEDLGASEELACAPHHTLLVTSEPSTIKTYGTAYVQQFGTVLTSQEPWALQHPGAVRSQPALKWFYGWPLRDTTGVLRDHASMVANPPEVKSKTLSTLCSNKQMGHTLHKQRFAFTQYMRNRLPELDVFGWGNIELLDKAEGLDAYRYHLAIENHVAPHHWTEKLSDAFLGLTLPLYVGCPNAADYFPVESFVALDLSDFDQAGDTIERAIKEDWYTQRLPAIREARRRVLEEYNFFAVVADLIGQRHGQATQGFTPVTAKPGQIDSRRKARSHTLVRKAQYLAEDVRVQTKWRFKRVRGKRA